MPVTGMSFEVQQKVLDAAPDHLKYAVGLALFSGLRRGETCALRWGDIKGNRMLVARSRYNGVDGPTKTGLARTVTLPAVAVELLRNRGEDHERIVPIEPHTLTVRWERLCKRIGLREYRFHDLRHAHATVLAESGVHPRVVQERLGHSDVRTTLAIYSHVMPSMESFAVSALDTAWASGHPVNTGVSGSGSTIEW